MRLSVRTRRLLATAKDHLWLFAFVPAAIGAWWQWSTTNSLERWKQEAALIQKALEPADKRIAAANLKVLLHLRLIRDENYPEIQRYVDNPETIPGFGGAALRDGLVTVSEAKRVLIKQGKYKGEDSNADSPAFRRALARFQLEQGDIEPDGLLGPKTLRALMRAAPEAFEN